MLNSDSSVNGSSSPPLLRRDSAAAISANIAAKQKGFSYLIYQNSIEVLLMKVIEY